MTSATQTTFAEVGLQLHAKGYRPFPGVQQTKVPALTGWNGLNQMPWDADDLQAAIEEYQPAADYCCCTAIQAALVAIDIDILDTQAATATNWQQAPGTALVRIGRGQQLRFTGRAAAYEPQAHPVEIFSGSGQCVLRGIKRRGALHWPTPRRSSLQRQSRIPKVTARNWRVHTDLFKSCHAATSRHSVSRRQSDTIGSGS
jgi:hypothetical protein